MASARARLGAARRSMIKRQKKTDVGSGILGTASTVAAFAGTQAKKAKTAWEEYETGYKALGGTEPIDKGGWFKSTFGGPKGEVGIGKGRKYKAYDMEQVRKAGSFLGSDASTALFAGEGGDDIRTKYLERTAPGVEKTRHHDPTKSYPESFQQMQIDPSTIDPGTGTGFAPTGISPKHERMMRVRSATPSTTESFQQQPVAFEQGSESKRFAQSMNQPINVSELATQMPSIPEEVTGGIQGRWQQRMRLSEDIPEFTQQMPIDPSTLDRGTGKMGPHYGGASAWERFWNRAIPEYRQAPRMKEYSNPNKTLQQTYEDQWK